MEDYIKDSDGKPCYAWNWGKDCGFQASHGTALDNLLHMCAWCAYKFKCQLAAQGAGLPQEAPFSGQESECFYCCNDCCE